MKRRAGHCLWSAAGASLAMGALTVGGWTAEAAVVRTERVDAVVYDVGIEGVRLDAVAGRNDASAVRPRLEGVEGFEAVYGVVGAPDLPVIRLFVEGDVTVEAETAGELRTLERGVRIQPAAASVVKIPGARRLVLADEAVYSHDRFVVGRAYDVVDAGSVRGVPRKLVTLYPVDYNPVSGEIRMISRFSVVQLGNRQIAALEAEDKGGIAFVVAPAFANSAALADYIAYKEAQGYKAHKIVYGRDATSVDGVRAALRGLLSGANLKHAVIVGDSDGVPAKRAGHMSGVTDHYYRAIDTDNYESDINGPDIGLGRISVRSEAELQTVVDRYKRYETRRGDDIWELGAAFIATSDTGFYRTAEGTHNYTIDTHTRRNGYFGNFPSARIPGGDKLYAITNRASSANVLSAVKEGRNFVIYSGHGSSGGWAGPGFSSSNIRSLTDVDFMPFVMGFACNTGAYAAGTETFAETWQRHTAGAVLYFGSVDSSYWDEDDVLQRRIFDAIFSGKTGFGDAINYGLSELWRQYGGSGFSKYYWESYTVFADPSVAVRLGDAG